MKEFSRGQRIRVASGGELEVIQKLGEGGQGVVYKVNYNGKAQCGKRIRQSIESKYEIQRWVY